MPTHGQEVDSQLVSLATQKLRSLGYPFELWNLEHLQTAFQKRHCIHLSDSTIWEWLKAEGLEWKRQESWGRIERRSKQIMALAVSYDYCNAHRHPYTWKRNPRNR